MISNFLLRFCVVLICKGFGSTTNVSQLPMTHTANACRMDDSPERSISLGCMHTYHKECLVRACRAKLQHDNFFAMPCPVCKVITDDVLEAQIPPEETQIVPDRSWFRLFHKLLFL